MPRVNKPHAVRKLQQAYLACSRTTTRVKDHLQKRKHAPPKVLLGCSYPTLLEHLGSELKPGVQIDHIIPLRCYDRDSATDHMRMFNWENTQLLDDYTHLGKGTGLPDEATLRRLRHLWPHAWDAAYMLLSLANTPTLAPVPITRQLAFSDQ